MAEFKAAAEAGDAHAQCNLGWCLRSGTEGVAKDERAAVEWLLKAAAQGDGLAFNNLGVCYSKGTGVERDERKAVEYYAEAAQRGNAMGQYNMACVYQTGRAGFGKDIVKAADLFSKAAEQDYEPAQSMIGNLLMNGIGIAKDEKAGLQWLRKAADQGNADAQLSVGFYLEQGRGAPADTNTAAQYYRKSAEQGSAEAQFCFAMCLHDGIGLAVDQKAAAEMYRLAANSFAAAKIALQQGHAAGVFAYAENLEHGSGGLMQDGQGALFYYRRAAAAGHPHAHKKLASAGASNSESSKWFDSLLFLLSDVTVCVAALYSSRVC